MEQNQHTVMKISSPEIVRWIICSRTTTKVTHFIGPDFSARYGGFFVRSWLLLAPLPMVRGHAHPIHLAYTYSKH
eukprot:1040596-Pyramimonas_sp.AAC.1